jgi:formylglycine-generating enzyme required for sulfatase activity
MTIPSQLLRGGSWNSYPRFCRSACRVHIWPGVAYGSLGIGFRVVCLPQEQPPSTMLLRGSSWYGDRRVCRSAYRSYFRPDNGDLDIGFRVVCLSQPAALLKAARGSSQQPKLV